MWRGSEHGVQRSTKSPMEPQDFEGNGVRVRLPASPTDFPTYQHVTSMLKSSAVEKGVIHELHTHGTNPREQRGRNSACVDIVSQLTGGCP
jgi:hypothetical protein